MKVKARTAYLLLLIFHLTRYSNAQTDTIVDKTVVPDNTTAGFDIIKSLWIRTQNGSTFLMIRSSATGDNATSSDRAIDLLNAFRSFSLYFKYVIVPGFITNPISFALSLQVKPFEKTELYIAVLSIADFSACVLRFSQFYLYEIGFNWTEYICRGSQYLSNTSSMLSNYIILCWTFERTIAVTFPLMFNIWFSFRKVIILLSIVCVLCFLISVPHLTEFTAAPTLHHPFTVVCYPSHLFSTFWAPFSMVYRVIVPLLFIIVCNIVIIQRLTKRNHSRIQLTAQNSISKKNRLLTITLISVCVIFVILHIPYIVSLMYLSVFPDLLVNSSDPRRRVESVFLHFGALVVVTIQNWINIFVYILTGTKYRQAFKNLFKFHVRCSMITHGTSVTQTRTNNTRNTDPLRVATV
ncbi:gonadotropin-releasing hormone receptor-like [Dreissena polymorpha]|uniref:gonadotropin-releasing hormone receptor-like n=1 Tax=Dreissena polymorpha TaxID=45954 RepID=UPI002263D4F8|nr:gonadotropin-releasing hormone receptor-like [Dreissena polymorpha]